MTNFMRKMKKQNSGRDTNPRPVSAKLFKKRFPNNFFSFLVSRGDSDYLCTMDCGNHWLPNDLQGKCFLSHENVCTVIKDLNVISEKTFNFESILKRHSPVRVKKLCLDKSLKSKRKSPLQHAANICYFAGIFIAVDGYSGWFSVCGVNWLGRSS